MGHQTQAALGRVGLRSSQTDPRPLGGRGDNAAARPHAQRLLSVKKEAVSVELQGHR